MKRTMFRSFLLAALATFATVVAAATTQSNPQLDLKVERLSPGGWAQTIATVQVPDAEVLPVTVPFKRGTDVPYVSEALHTVDHDGSYEVQRKKSTVFSGMSGSITRIGDRLQVKVRLTEITEIIRFEDPNDPEAWIELPQRTWEGTELNDVKLKEGTLAWSYTHANSTGLRLRLVPRSWASRLRAWAGIA